ncbi:FimV family protein [Pseudomonas lalucatii]|uniref:FimV family protein n=1 Tax=Pseudomonas lalucatii TaxID=1424203 RepID=A0ABS5PWY2_9PSED|nr:FimV family protein [Pseudomonas lalucatii]
MVPALGLGEITLHSALNQPLEADIELLEVADLSADDLKISLAPAEVFSRSGVERFYFLNDLRFTPLLRGGGGIIRVRSSRPVREPYLNFIVEVARPNGRLLREYTLLLDPPGSSAYRAVTTAPGAMGRIQPAAAAPAVQPAETRPKPPARLDTRYRVVRGDSLWKIAARLRAEGSEATQQALMADIHALNPRAFARGDINQLLVSAELLLPDSAAAARQIDDTGTPAAPAPDSRALAAGEPAAPQSVDPQVESITQAQRRVERELADQAAESLQLQQQLAQMQLQIQQLQAQMDSKDQQLAVLQARLAEAQVPAAAPSGQPAAASGLAAAGGQQARGEPAAIQGRNWFAVGAAALLLVVASLAALLWRSSRRRVRREEELQPEPPVVAVADEEPLAALVQPSRVAEVAPSPEAPSAAMSPPAPLADALEGANIYIAYGRFGAAADALRKALAAQPERQDIRFRLLEVLAQLGDVQAFAEQEALFRAGGAAASRVDEIKARYPQLNEQAFEDPLEDAVLAFEDLQPQASGAEPAEDFQLNLDDLSLDADWDLVTPFEQPASKQPVVQDELGSAGPEAGAIGDTRSARSPFAETMLVEEANAEDWLQEELTEDFAGQPLGGNSPLLVELDQLEGDRDNLSKLNLALAYIEQGSLDSACGILNQVISEGDEVQKQQARELLAKIA